VTKSKGVLAPRAVWTEEQLEMLRRQYPHFKTENVAFMIGHTIEQVYRKAKALGLQKTAEYLASPAACRLRRADEGGGHVGSEYRFQKGHSSWNKGTKGVHTGGEQTQFKPGQLPHNTLPIGSYRHDKSGVLQRKIGNGKGSNSKRWRGVHELVWSEHNGPVPAKHIVVFKPGMRTAVLEEITIDRVECISLAENMKRNTRHNLPPELNEVIQLRAVLTRHINTRTRNEIATHN
jgi:hypothetical protein